MWTSPGLGLSSPDSALVHEPFQAPLPPTTPEKALVDPEGQDHGPAGGSVDFSPSVFFAEQPVEGWDVPAPTSSLSTLLAC